MKNSGKLPLILLAVFLLFLISGCSAKSSSSYGIDHANTAAKAAAGGTYKSADSASGTSSASALSQAAASSRKIIMSASVTLKTADYEKSVAALENLVTQYGGFVQDSSTQGTGSSVGESRTASYTVRIPSEKLNSFLNGITGIGTLVSKSVRGEDVTQSYYDTQSRLKTLQSEQARILEILNKTTSMSDVLSIEERLSDVENQIEQLTGELKQWNELVDLSTVTISLREVKSTAPSASSFGSQLTGVLRSSVDALGLTIRYILIVLAAVLPFAVVIGGIGAVIVLIRRRINKKRAGKKPAAPPEEAPPKSED